MNNLIKAADELAGAIDDERNMVCQDFGMQQDASLRTDTALTAYRTARNEQVEVNMDDPEIDWVEDACNIFDNEAQSLGWTRHIYSDKLRKLRDEKMTTKVKPLVWEHHPAGVIAAPPTGFAYILDTRGKHRVTSIKGFNPRREFDDLDAAKAAAQADYETRIRSTLDE